MWIDVTIAVLLIIGSAFFSASETALTSVPTSLVTAKAKKGVTSAKLIVELLKDRSTLIIVLLTINNFINIFFSTLVTVVGLELFNPHYIFLIAAGNTVVILLFGEILPKTYAFSRPSTVAFFVSPLVYLIVKVASPFTKILIIINNFFLRLTLKKHQTIDSHASVDNLRGAIDLMQRNNSVTDKSKAIDHEKDMLNSVLDLYDINISEIMIHRKNVFCIDIDDPIEDIIKSMLSSNFTKIPVYKNSQDNIIGIVYLKEVVSGYYQNSKDFDLKKLIKKPIYFPETTSAFDLLRFFQESREKIVIIVDEYGGFMGIISVYDVLEEIVGEVKNKSHKNNIQKTKNSYIISGDMTIRDLNRQLKLNLPDDNATTLAGIILYETGRIPNTGNIFSLHGFKFEILEKKNQQIVKIKLTPLDH